ncbi:MAG TPA: serine/threonine-protein kinase [Planctomycetota bacterium]|nr:serine/threonine-protein kinase [Planctomycetota bacterium]
MSLLEEGQVIRGTWTIERKLGEGAFAEVFRVKHHFLGRQAMKVFKTAGMTLEKTRELLSEAALLSSLAHHNIIRVFDANITETSLGICGFFTMELVQGGSLHDFWRRHGNQFVPLKDSVEIIRQVCRGLALAHSQDPPIIHRDIKPQNILVGYDVQGLHVRLSDFGLAKQVNPLSRLATAAGTPGFKGPEVFLKEKQDSAAGDVFAVGTTLYLLLTDRFPYTRSKEDELGTVERFRNPYIPPSQFNLQVDRELEAITQKSLALKPADRYPSSRELLADLERWQPRANRPDPKPPKETTADKTILALGPPPSSVDVEEAQRMVQEAFRLANYGTLTAAADLMEKALNAWPPLREKHERTLIKWRKGVHM